MIILKPGKERRLIAGHCWIYSGEIAQISEEAKDGDAVEIRDQRKRYLGLGLLNTKSQITVRRFTTQKEELGKDFFRRRLEAAIAYRQGSEVCRLVFSESDQLPGLIVDRFGDVLVLQALTLGIDQRKSMIAGLLRELLHPKAIIERSDVPSRRLEGLEETKSVLWGESTGQQTINVAGIQFEVNLLEDQKTGFFLDQAENYVEVARHCAGKRVLDCFSYHGGFALFAAQAGATSVEAIEISEAAVAHARRNVELNNLTGKVEFTCANAFDVLKKYDTEKRQFDVIILDPPTFTRTKANVAGALRGYKEIILRALKMLPAGGVLAAFSCSHHVTGEMLKSVVVDAAADARKSVRQLDVLSQSADHPILPTVPETEYLKGFLLQVLSA
jgi:23S rRNA (cytosine1962-C5)-methyltransferase